MANLLICYPDRAGDATLSEGSWQASLPLDNLKSLPLGRVARSTNVSASSTKIKIALSTSRAISVLVLCAHNLSINAQYKLTASANSSLSPTVYDSGWLDVWPRIWTTEQLEWEDDRWWDGTISAEERESYVSNLVHAFASTLAQYWRLELSDTGNADGYVQAGRLFLATGWQPTVNYDYGNSFGWETTVQAEQSLGGQQYFSRQAHQRVFRLGLSWLISDEAHGRVWEIQRALGVDGELFVVPDMDDVVNLTRRAFLARLRALDPIVYPQYLYYQAAFEFIEVL